MGCYPEVMPEYIANVRDVGGNIVRGVVDENGVAKVAVFADEEMR